jgi:hypothetical protein
VILTTQESIGSYLLEGGEYRNQGSKDATKEDFEEWTEGALNLRALELCADHRLESTRWSRDPSTVRLQTCRDTLATLYQDYQEFLKDPRQDDAWQREFLPKVAALQVSVIDFATALKEECTEKPIIPRSSSAASAASVATIAPSASKFYFPRLPAFDAHSQVLPLQHPEVELLFESEEVRRRCWSSVDGGSACRCT